MGHRGDAVVRGDRRVRRDREPLRRVRFGRAGHGPVRGDERPDRSRALRDSIDSKTKTAINPGRGRGHLESRDQDQVGKSDVYVLQNTIAPGGTFGSPSHPGPSLVIVKSGPATFYHGDPGCPKEVVSAGTGFVDGGHDLHVVRNEGNVDLVTVVVSMVPAGFERRIDEPPPANCPF